MSSPSTAITMNASRNQRTAESAHSAEGHRSGARSSFWRWSCRKSDLRFGGMVPDAENGPGFLAEVLRKVAGRELNVGPTYSSRTIASP